MGKRGVATARAEASKRSDAAAWVHYKVATGKHNIEHFITENPERVADLEKFCQPHTMKGK